jgi:photosystem II stability/assembly factor-like uncharacterized protein
VAPIPSATVIPASLSCLDGSTCLAVGATANVSGQAAVWETTDGGATWNAAPAPSMAELHSITCVHGSSYCTTVGSGTQMATTPDGGTTWGIATVPVPGSLTQLTEAACGDTTHCIVTTLTQAVGVTTNGGHTFTQVSMPAGLVSQSAFCNRSGVCLIGGSWLGRLAVAGMVARSTDHGRTWTSVWTSD